MKMKITFASDDEKVFERDIRTIEDLVELQALYQAPILFDVEGYFDANLEEYLPSLTIYDDYME